MKRRRIENVHYQGMEDGGYRIVDRRRPNRLNVRSIPDAVVAGWFTDFMRNVDFIQRVWARAVKRIRQKRVMEETRRIASILGRALTNS